MVFANTKFSFLYFINSSLFPTGNWCPTGLGPPGCRPWIVHSWQSGAPGHIHIGYKQILLKSKNETEIYRKIPEIIVKSLSAVFWARAC